jgi:lipopolysaccharide export LptBFGC system permease protein LptF
MILARHLGKLFLMRLISLILVFLGILFIFEAIMARKFFQLHTVLTKLPLIFHQVFPFLIVLSVLLFMWRLIRFHALEIFHSAGLSLWFILRVPFFIVLGLSLCDLMILVPLSHQMINPFKEKQGKLSLDAGGWQVRIHPQGYSLVRLDAQRPHILTFSLDSTFRNHRTAAQGIKQSPYFVFKNAWEIFPYAPPRGVPMLKEEIQEWSLAQNQHPGLMSFAETAQALEGSHIPKGALRSRQDYLLSHTFWILSLVPLAAALVVGRTGRYKKIVHIVLGLMLCAFLYVVKEWLYKTTLPLSFTWQPLSLWAVPIFTALLALIILFEKKEL